MQQDALVLKELLANQQAIYSDFSTYALAIIGIVATAQFLLNRYLSRMQIHDAVAKYFSSFSKDLIEENKKTVDERLSMELLKMKRAQRKMSETLSYEDSRSLAMHARREGLKDIELRCWFSALRHAVLANAGLNIRTAADAIVSVYENSDKSWKTPKLKKEVSVSYEKTVKKMPKSLHLEKEKILSLLEEIYKI